jgi:hypothetical protein
MATKLHGIFEKCTLNSNKPYYTNSSGTEVRVLARRNPTKDKPHFYLVLKNPNAGFEYISSLFPVTDTKYSIDYSGIQYWLEKVDQTKIKVYPKNLSF